MARLLNLKKPRQIVSRMVINLTTCELTLSKPCLILACIVRIKMEEIVLSQFSDTDVWTPRLSLHDLCVDLAKAGCKIALDSSCIGSRQVKVQIRHEYLP